jgi:ATP-dependent Clp endopeptidase proteolytic subunit ClpP
MPLPSPNEDESHDDWIERCMGNSNMNEEFPESDQRHAVCQSIWDEDKKDMKTHDIYAYGDIWNDQSDYASEWGVVSLVDIVKQMNENKDAEEYIVHIHSRGGEVDEGFAIHDVLVASGKKITTIIEGMCYSIATIVALAGTERKMTENSNFMIHNPTGGGFGDADDMQKYADKMKEYQDKIIDFYVNKTGADRDKIVKLTEEETEMTAEEAKDLGFISEIIETIKAVAHFNINPKYKTEIMENDLKDLKKEVTGLKAFFTTLFNIKDDGAKNLKLLTADGTELTIDTEDTKPAVGDKVSVDGKTLEESYVMPDGETINIKDNVIESIVPKKVEDKTESEELKNLKQKVADQEKTINDLKTKDESYKTEIAGIKKDMDFVIENVKSTFAIDDKTRIALKNTGGNIEDPIAEAIVRRKQRKLDMEANKNK